MFYFLETLESLIQLVQRRFHLPLIDHQFWKLRIPEIGEAAFLAKVCPKDN